MQFHPSELWTLLLFLLWVFLKGNTQNEKNQNRIPICARKHTHTPARGFSHRWVELRDRGWTVSLEGVGGRWAEKVWLHSVWLPPLSSLASHFAAGQGSHRHERFYEYRGPGPCCSCLMANPKERGGHPFHQNPSLQYPFMSSEQR